MMKAAQARGIPNVMLNTNGKRIATDDGFLAELAEIRPNIYFQFDGFESETYRIIRGEADILPKKLRALDRLAEIGCSVILVPAIERGVNEKEIGRIVRFGLDHPAVKGINFQPAFHTGRHSAHDPMRRITNPDIIRLIEDQTEGMFRKTDFVPVPCCFPTCNSVTYAYIDDEKNVTPLPRILNVEDYLDYISNRVMPDLGAEIRRALEGLWSSSAVQGSEKVAREFSFSCSACGLPDGGLDVNGLSNFMFMIMLQDFMDPWTFNQKNLMKCCKEFLLPGGKQVPFCAYNTVGYREQARQQLMGMERSRVEARRAGVPYEIQPVNFSFVRQRRGGRSVSETQRESAMNPNSEGDVKSCCATLYESDLARMLLGDSFHPGGMRLTERLGEMLGLAPGYARARRRQRQGRERHLPCPDLRLRGRRYRLRPRKREPSHCPRGGRKGCASGQVLPRRRREDRLPRRDLRRADLRVRFLHFPRQRRCRERVRPHLKARRQSRIERPDPSGDAAAGVDGIARLDRLHCRCSAGRRILGVSGIGRNARPSRSNRTMKPWPRWCVTFKANSLARS